MCRFQKSRQKNTKTHGNAAINVSVPVFVLSGLLHRIKGVNLDESNFPMRALAIEKSFLTANRQKNRISLSSYPCQLFSIGTPSEKYFSIGIQIFLSIFTHTGLF